MQTFWSSVENRVLEIRRRCRDCNECSLPQQAGLEKSQRRTEELETWYECCLQHLEGDPETTPETALGPSVIKVIFIPSLLFVPSMHAYYYRYILNNIRKCYLYVISVPVTNP